MIEHDYIAADAGVEGNPKRATITVRMEAAHAFIERAFRGNPTLDEMAGIAQVSSFHFHRLFRSRYGKTPKRVVSELQIAEVQRLVRAGTTLQDASVLTGFSHQSHMTIRFKQLIGVTPAQWRRTVRMAG